MKTILFGSLLFFSACSRPVESSRTFQVVKPSESILKEIAKLPSHKQFNGDVVYCSPWKPPTGLFQVYLQHPGIQTIGTPYQVWVFDEASHLQMAGNVTAPQDYVPHSIEDAPKLTLIFSDPSRAKLSDPELVREVSAAEMQKEEANALETARNMLSSTFEVVWPSDFRGIERDAIYGSSWQTSAGAFHVYLQCPAMEASDTLYHVWVFDEAFRLQQAGDVRMPQDHGMPHSIGSGKKLSIIFFHSSGAKLLDPLPVSEIPISDRQKEAAEILKALNPQKN